MAGEKKLNSDGLNPQQAAFVKHYLQLRNATQAAIKAGYSAKTAAEQASRLLRDVRIATAVAAGEQKFAEKMEITTEKVLREVARLAFFDPRKLFDADGKPLAINELDDDTAAAIAGMEVVTEFEGRGSEREAVGYVKKYKVADKNAAAEKLMKYLGLFREDNKQKSAGVEELIAFLESRHQAGQTKLPIRAPKTKKI